MERRDLFSLAALAAGSSVFTHVAAKEHTQAPSSTRLRPVVQAADGTRLHYEDWGSGPTIVFIAPWSPR